MADARCGASYLLIMDLQVSSKQGVTYYKSLKNPTTMLDGGC
jgi:hypothetical protein